MQKILISGAGIAGLTAAFWLTKFGYQVEIIDRVNDLQARDGYAIDFWGPGMDVAAEMDIVGELEKINLDFQTINFSDQHGKIGSSLHVKQMLALYPNGFVTVLRGGLERILLEKLVDKAQISLGKTISAINNTADKVIVTFHDNSTADYDYLIGSDGVHSQVRELLWGQEDKFSIDLGYQVCAFITTANNDLDHTVNMFNAPKCACALMPLGKQRIAAYGIYRNDLEQDVHSDLERIRTCFSGFPENVTTLINNLQAENLFHDKVEQISVPEWHKGRVILLGDACQCLTLVAGQGASMAMASAYTLAHAIKNNNIEHYSKIMQPIIKTKQQAARG
ncbi:MAG: FAD-dependent monooxygenase, partial [Candidatus Thioglobus sp.]